MRLFGKSKKATAFQPASPSTQWARNLANGIGTRVAHVLASCDRRLSNRQRQAAITLFCLAATMFSLGKLYQALYLPNTNLKDHLAPPGIVRPVSPLVGDSNKVPHRHLVPDDTFPGPAQPDSFTK